MKSQNQEPTARRIVECVNACAQMDDPAKGIAETGALLNRVCAENSRLRGALAFFCEAFDNRGETTSLKEWNSRMKLAYADAQRSTCRAGTIFRPKGETMKIKTEFWAKPIPMRQFDWAAYDEDSYDGAEDAGPTSRLVGYGRTQEEAIKNLIQLFEECAIALAPEVSPDTPHT